MITVSRRVVLGLLGGGVASIGLAYVTVRSFAHEDLVRMVLERYFGPLNMAENELRSFTQEFRAQRPTTFPTENLADVSALLEKLRLASAARPILPGDRGQRLEHFERWLLADFHLLTDYAWRRSPGDPIRFTGSQPCANPFAIIGTANNPQRSWGLKSNRHRRL
ncbi:MAG: hypothetical protein E5W15_08885 [Mesorhizobium sp.]|uniref:hypothetical protein n=2 Tax=unclassified Mesorhizobium TaxID=325217 RepID=UPI000FE95A18|nr:MAG: hypothetical protein EOQ48_32105 [Mesorhizobium sp.]TIU73138.1 MAG: hypothetical protein E5W15_08885 [Mesorhizobium sp.]